MSTSRFALISALAFVFANLSVDGATAQEWSRFRGPNGTGVSDAKTVPVKFTEADYNWKVKLPGVGHSQPVFWGGKIFLTSALRKGEERLLMCLDEKDGSIVWKKSLANKTHGKHRLNSYASATPAVDKDRIYVTFANADQYLLLAFDHDGQRKWQHNLGEFTSRHGQALSPMVFEDLVIIGKEQGRDAPSSASSFIVAIDKNTGSERWKCPRSTKTVSYSTPCIFTTKSGEPRLLCNSQAHGISCLDPRSGKVIWWSECFDKRAVSSAIFVNGLAFGSCGSGGGGNYLVGIRPGGEGDVSKTHEAFRFRKAAPYVPTPVAEGDLLFLFADKGGIVSCVDTKTGMAVWQNRIDASLSFSGSPVNINGRIYCVSDGGELVVIAAAREYQLLARIELGEPSRCTPAVSNGRMYLRTFNESADYTHLISVGGSRS